MVNPPPTTSSERRRLLLEVFAVMAHEALCADVGQPGRQYLTAVRGFDGNRLQGLPFGWYSTASEVEAQLISNGFTRREAMVVAAPSDTSWDGRIVCPVRDPRGVLRTFFSRDITGNAPHHSRYSFLSHGTKPVAFGLDVALQDRAFGKDDLLLVEGLIDVIALNSRGILNVAAIGGQGKYLTSHRWRALRELGIRRVTLLLDNDQYGREGIEAAIRAARCATAAPEVMAVDPTAFAPFKDPDELIRLRGVDAFRLLVNRERVQGCDYLRFARGKFGRA